MFPKDFIKVVLINEIGEINSSHQFLSFSLIATGIEFLGKCILDKQENWHNISPDKAFKEGVKLLILQNSAYKDLDLKNQLRNGFAHTLLPKSNIVLSERKHQVLHLSENGNGKKILVAENFYQDFKKACEIVISMKFDKKSKMNKGLLEIKK